MFHGMLLLFLWQRPQSFLAQDNTMEEDDDPIWRKAGLGLFFNLFLFIKIR